MFWILYLMFWSDLRRAHFTVSWTASPDPTVEGYRVHWWAADLPSPQLVTIEDVGLRNFAALQKRHTHVTVTAYAAGGIESLPSRTVSWPGFQWMWWTPPWPWVLQESDDLVVWRDSPVLLAVMGVFGGIDCYAPGKKFYRLRADYAVTPIDLQ